MDVILDGICKSFGQKVVLENVSLSFPEARITCIQGPSGCGKTTLLNIIAGLVKPDSGRVLGINGRKVAYAFQEPRLLPWKDVRQNVGFVLPPSIDSLSRSRTVSECLELVEMSEFVNEMPSALSGGMSQRVSLARALAANAGILLLDEAFSALDNALKDRVIANLKYKFSKEGTTVIMVSHSKEETDSLAGYVISLK